MGGSAIPRSTAASRSPGTSTLTTKSPDDEMHGSAQRNGSADTTPAASDRAVDFVVPSSIPEKDEKLFEQMFTR